MTHIETSTTSSMTITSSRIYYLQNVPFSDIDLGRIVSNTAVAAVARDHVGEKEIVSPRSDLSRPPIRNDILGAWVC